MTFLLPENSIQAQLNVSVTQQYLARSLVTINSLLASVFCIITFAIGYYYYYFIII